eukprot:gene15595-biopygen3698
MNEVKSPSNGARGAEKVMEGAHRRNGMRSIWTRPNRTRTNRRMNEEGKGENKIWAHAETRRVRIGRVQIARGFQTHLVCAETCEAQQQHARRPRAAPTGQG